MWQVRIANNTITCDGPWLVVYRERPPEGVVWETMPAEWAVGGVVRLSIAKGTLVPASELHAGRNKPTLSPGSAPKRQRRAQTYYPQLAAGAAAAAAAGVPVSSLPARPATAGRTRGPDPAEAWREEKAFHRRLGKPQIRSVTGLLRRRSLAWSLS